MGTGNVRSSDPPVSALEMVRAGLAALAAADVVVLPDQQVRDEVLALLDSVSQLHAVLAERIGSFDLRDLSEGDAVRTTLSWLRIFGRMSEGSASGWLGPGQAAAGLPTVAAAARAGTVSAEHLSPIRRLVKEIGTAAVRDFDEALATVAAGADPKQVGMACARIHAYVDPDGRPPNPAEDFERRELSLRPVGSMVHIRGRLDPEGGAALTAAIDALMRPPTPDEERTAPQRRADALVDLARGSIGTGGLPTVGGLAPERRDTRHPEGAARPRPHLPMAQLRRASHLVRRPPRDPLGQRRTYGHRPPRRPMSISPFPGARGRVAGRSGPRHG